MTKPPASIGDALIFMTKALVVIVVLIVGTIWLVVWNANRSDRAELALRNAHAEVLNLGDKLDACFKAGAGQEWTDAELDAVAPCPTSAPCKPWERAWWPYDPTPPPGFVSEPAGEP